MSGLRVLHVINEMGTGGAERLVADTVRGGDQRGWISTVLSSGGVRADELSAEGYRTLTMRMARRSPLALLSAVRGVRRALRRVHPDVVVAHNVLVSLVVWMAGHTLRNRPPLVTVFHGVGAADYSRAGRLLNRTSDVVVAVSGAIAERLRAAGFPQLRLTVIHNAVPVPARPPDGAAARRAIGLVPGVPVVLCAARMVEQKRHDVLLAAWKQMPEDAVLLLAGDGPLRAELEEAAGRDPHIRFLGRRDDVTTLLAAADVCVLTSDWEGLPMIVLEAVASGRPVVATDVDGLREVLGDGRGGLLVPPDDPDAVAAALRTLLDDAGRRADLVARGQEWLRRHHTRDGMLDRYDGLLRDTRLRGAARRPGLAWIGIRAGLAGLLVFSVVFAAVLAAPARYQASMSVAARPLGTPQVVEPGGAEPVSTGYGEVVALAMPSLSEVVTGPTLLAEVSATVPGAPPPDELRGEMSVDLVPASGLARIGVRADDADTAARLAEAVAARAVNADLLGRAGSLRLLDTRSSVTSVSPDAVTGGALAALAGAVAATATAAFLLPRRRTIPHAALIRALAHTGREGVPVFDGEDPVLAERVRLLAGTDPLRVVAVTPGLDSPVHALARQLHVEGCPDRAAVLAVADRRRTRRDDLVAAVRALPSTAPLLGVVLV